MEKEMIFDETTNTSDPNKTNRESAPMDCSDIMGNNRSSSELKSPHFSYQMANEN